MTFESRGEAQIGNCCNHDPGQIQEQVGVAPLCIICKHFDTFRAWPTSKQKIFFDELISFSHIFLERIFQIGKLEEEMATKMLGRATPFLLLQSKTLVAPAWFFPLHRGENCKKSAKCSCWLRF